MKKLIFAAMAASTLLSTPAMARNWEDLTYGHDAVGIYDVNSTVGQFCKFGAQNNSGTGITNATVTTGNSEGGTAAEADGTFTLNIQDQQDDTVQAAEGRYNIDYAVCNMGFDMTVNSQNGGLKTTASTSDPAFTELVPYNVAFVFDGIGGDVHHISTGDTLVASSTEARAGGAHVTVKVRDSGELLLQGTYSDVLTASVTPTVGSTKS